MFCHPNFATSQSMPRFAQMLTTAYRARGHRVEVWSPKPYLFKWIPYGRLSKWAGYADQYVIFPLWVRRAAKLAAPDTLFVFCDQALGPWVPLVAGRPHVVHAHDLLALRSALGDVLENPTSITGRVYQNYIRRGFRRGRHFISISAKTREDLHRFGGVSAVTSDVVYNGLNFPYKPLSISESDSVLRPAGLALPPSGFLLHVGGGQWYKNLAGVISLYAAYVSNVPSPLPLWCVSPEPNSRIKALLRELPDGLVRFVRNLDSITLQAMYSRASAFLFPSLAEGFGWPIIEAMACGCPVITTDEAPMNEIGGEAALYLPRLKSPADMAEWSTRGANALRELLAEKEDQKSRRRAMGRAWVNRFDANRAIDDYLSIYQRIVDMEKCRGEAASNFNERTLI